MGHGLLDGVAQWAGGSALSMVTLALKLEAAHERFDQSGGVSGCLMLQSSRARKSCAAQGQRARGGSVAAVTALPG